ncbi:reverse transcriptase domain-containing protein, partial [Bacillus sp. SRB_8]|uniref:reverse transcriptase domain-containing protein n=1 Tax=Bacillus sp. SRB_8 TaxID=1969377 RepID=UPI00283AA55F
MKQPDGFIEPGQGNLVCKLQKALYGLKQAGMIWNQQLDDFLVSKLHFRRTIADPCLYHLRCDTFYA